MKRLMLPMASLLMISGLAQAADMPLGHQRLPRLGRGCMPALMAVQSGVPVA
jgi:hypothetical protein